MHCLAGAEHLALDASTTRAHVPGILASKTRINSSNIRSYESSRALIGLQSLVKVAAVLKVQPGTLVKGHLADRSRRALLGGVAHVGVELRVRDGAEVDAHDQAISFDSTKASRSAGRAPSRRSWRTWGPCPRSATSSGSSSCPQVDGGVGRNAERSTSGYWVSVVLSKGKLNLRSWLVGDRFRTTNSCGHKATKSAILGDSSLERAGRVAVTSASYW